MELADLGRLRGRGSRAVLVRVLRPISNHARFSMGEFFDLWNWRGVVDLRLVPCVRPAAGLSRKDLRLDLRSDCCASFRLFQLCHLLHPVPGAGFSWRSACWAKGA